VNQLKEYREQGYLHARGVFDAEELEELRGAIDRILESVAGTEHDRNHRWQAVAQEAVLKGFHDVQYHDAAFTRAAAQPRLVAILTELLGPNVQLHHTKMLVKPPAQGASFPMHQDYPYFPHERHSVVAASVHLDDTDLENGCLRVVPGSQGLGPLELAIVLFIVLVLVGGRRLPQLGRQLGDGVREFKDSVTKRTDAQYDDDTREKPAAAALGRPAGEESPVDGEVMRERS